MFRLTGDVSADSERHDCLQGTVDNADLKVIDFAKSVRECNLKCASPTTNALDRRHAGITLPTYWVRMRLP